MRAVLCHAYGPADTLDIAEVPGPTPGPGQVHLAVHACGVNFADTLMITGKYQEKPPFPFTPGLEVAGDVLAVGDGVTRIKPGQRVFAITSGGGYASECLANADSVFAIPDSMDYVTAACFPVAYGTAYGALHDRAHLQAGETLLVHGAAGGVGLTAVEVGKATAATVIATASSDAKLDIAKAHGADHAILSSADDLRDQVRGLTDGRGADVIYDPVGGDLFDTSLRCIAWEGRIIVIGFAAGRIPQIPANILLVKNATAIGYFWGSYRKHRPQALVDQYDALLRWFEEGKLQPHVSHRFDLADVADAHAVLLGRKSTGKVALTTGRD
jgi:NADPH2:quinone reductase